VGQFGAAAALRRHLVRLLTDKLGAAAHNRSVAWPGEDLHVMRRAPESHARNVFARDDPPDQCLLKKVVQPGVRVCASVCLLQPMPGPPIPRSDSGHGSRNLKLCVEFGRASGVKCSGIDKKMETLSSAKGVRTPTADQLRPRITVSRGGQNANRHPRIWSELRNLLGIGLREYDH
jgi:hypothetical protein